MSYRKLSLIATLAFAALAQSAQAGFISQVDTFPPTDAPFSAPLIFNSFNTSLGTLTAVTIIVTENATVTASVINLTPGGATGTYSGVSTTGATSIQGPDGTTVSTSFSTAPASGSITGAFATKQVGSATGGGSTTSNLASSMFGAYEGPTSFQYVVDANGSVTTTGTSTSGVVGFFGTANISGSVEIDYTYTPRAIPEPASFVMVALGLGGIVAVRRFRRRAV